MQNLFAARYIGIVFWTMVIASHSVTAQQAVTRIEGFIRDEVSGSPVGCKIYVVGPNGKKQTLSSSSTDGTYLIVVNDAGTYKLTLGGYMVYRKEYSINVPASKKFQEIKQDYSVKALHEGDVVFSSIAFEVNSNSLNQRGKQDLNQLQEILKTNQEMTVKVIVVPDQDLLSRARTDSIAAYEKAHKSWEKDMAQWKKKNKKKQVSEPPVEPVMPNNIPDPNVQIVKDRRVAVLSYLHDVKNSDLRISAESGPLPQSAAAATETIPQPTTKSTSKSSKKKTGSTIGQTGSTNSSVKQHDNLVVKVGVVKRLFD
ncbi:MAG: hypothetical protein HYX66_04780 [Ignavibacteria bacterium]|nr:hypothetical protein [Ignavibacteria bacterium]